ncbi:MAG: YggS family pyridoxal phosphate-dependent enzyme [Lachnospira sp.]|nr:YggS family pyridoxal phosphate-dependent enzyme [Lachnospira sp.]
MIKENLQSVQDNIKEICRKCGRNPEDVTLIAVSKTKPNEMLMEAYDSGIREFGENYVQELSDKIETLPDDINWHMIGHLQRNKVKYIVGKVAMIHSVDSLRLAEAIDNESSKKGVKTDILVEVNVANEENKFGVTLEEAEDFIRQLSHFDNIVVRGLMTSAPLVDNPEKNRVFFRQLRQLLVDINAKNIDNIHMDVLSMGMTNDYDIAIEEGATHVRVGTAIFGARNYNK